jgi:hypothetical protein
LFQSLGSFGVVVHNPARKGNGAFDSQPQIADLPAYILEISAAAGILADFVNPRLDSVVAGLGSNLDFFVQRQLLPANCAGIKAIPEWHFGTGINGGVTSH